MTIPSSNGTSLDPIAILGGGPVGLALALLLARRAVPSIVFDARSVEQASADRRLLALSLGSLQTLGSIIELAGTADLPVMAPINTVIVSSVGQFGRAVIGELDVGAEMLGATIRYGDLINGAFICRRNRRRTYFGAPSAQGRGGAAIAVER